MRVWKPAIRQARRPAVQQLSKAIAFSRGQSQDAPKQICRSIWSLVSWVSCDYKVVAPTALPEGLKAREIFKKRRVRPRGLHNVGRISWELTDYVGLVASPGEFFNRPWSGFEPSSFIKPAALAEVADKPIGIVTHHRPCGERFGSPPVIHHRKRV